MGVEGRAAKSSNIKVPFGVLIKRYIIGPGTVFPSARVSGVAYLCELRER